jgi:hypothetical protein
VGGTVKDAKQKSKELQRRVSTPSVALRYEFGRDYLSLLVCDGLGVWVDLQVGVAGATCSGKAQRQNSSYTGK